MSIGFKFVIAALLLSRVASAQAPAGVVEPEKLRVEVLKTYPHDTAAFTQGLLLYGNTLFESTGEAGRSSLRQVDLDTGKVLRRVNVPLPYFGEGLALANDQLIQLTWQHGTAFVYDAMSFSERKRFAYAGEGWGLTYDGKQLIMTDGSDELTFRDPVSFAEIRKQKVTRSGKPLRRLNELEYVEGKVYSNVWLTQNIVVIDPQRGVVTANINARGLLTQEEASRADVLNGIAYDSKTGEFLITGKLWPKLFRVRFVPDQPKAH